MPEVRLRWSGHVKRRGNEYVGRRRIEMDMYVRRKKEDALRGLWKQ